MPNIVLHKNVSYRSGSLKFQHGKPTPVDEATANKLLATGRFLTEEDYAKLQQKKKDPKKARTPNPPKLVLDPETGKILRDNSKKNQGKENTKPTSAAKNGKVELPNFVSKKDLIKYGQKQYGISLDIKDEKGEDKKMKALIEELTAAIKESLIKDDAASDPEKEGATAV